MSILIHIYYTGKDGSAKRFAEEMVQGGIVGKIREERGNLRYAYFFPADDAETVLLIDEWQNQSALDVHHASPLMEQIMALRGKYDLHMRVERYISDTAGVPASDEAFIRK